MAKGPSMALRQASRVSHAPSKPSGGVLLRGMDALTRWIQKDANSAGGILRVFAFIAATLFLLALGAAGVQSLSETPPPEAWGLIGFLLLTTIGLAIPALRMKAPAKDRVLLAPLLNAIWQGKLAEALGEDAPRLAQAATDWEQAEALLPFVGYETSFTDSIRQAGESRMRRMLDLTVAPPGRFGLTFEQARQCIEGDAAWLAEVRRLVEASRAEVRPQGDDDTLGHLRAMVQAREEAVEELRLSQ